jgi:chaperonin GroES
MEVLEFPVTVPMQPLNDFVLVLPEEQERITAGGIVKPDMAQDRAVRGTVLAVGPGHYENRVLFPTVVTVGEHVMYGKYAGTDIQIAGVGYVVMREEEILGVLPSLVSGPMESNLSGKETESAK